MRISKGFTLIEMLVVMSVLALLLTIALPQYFGSLGKSKDVALQENLRILRVVIDQFHADKGRFPATLQELVDEKYLRAIPQSGRQRRRGCQEWGAGIEPGRGCVWLDVGALARPAAAGSAIFGCCYCSRSSVWGWPLLHSFMQRPFKGSANRSYWR